MPRKTPNANRLVLRSDVLFAVPGNEARYQHLTPIGCLTTAIGTAPVPSPRRADRPSQPPDSGQARPPASLRTDLRVQVT